MVAALWRSSTLLLLLSLWIVGELELSSAEEFVVFGRIEMDRQDFDPAVCSLEFSAKIGNYAWRRKLTENFYALRLPVDSFVGEPGMLGIDVVNENQRESLWSYMFVVQGSGGYEHNAVLRSSLICSSRIGPNEVEAAKPIVLAVRNEETTKLLVCPVFAAEGCSVQNSSTSDMERQPADYLPAEAEEQVIDDTQLVFGHRMQLVHLSTVASIATLLQIFIFLLRSFLSVSDSPSSYEQPQQTAKWELRPSPASTRRSPFRRSSVLASGEDGFDKAWTQAEQLLWSGKEDSACFYYNCSIWRNQREKGTGKWNRDSRGRLERVT